MCQNMDPAACEATGEVGGIDASSARRKKSSRTRRGFHLPNSSRSTGLSNAARDALRWPTIHVSANASLHASSQESHRSTHMCTHAKSSAGAKKFRV